MKYATTCVMDLIVTNQGSRYLDRFSHMLSLKIHVFASSDAGNVMRLLGLRLLQPSPRKLLLKMYGRKRYQVQLLWRTTAQSVADDFIHHSSSEYTLRPGQRFQHSRVA